MEYFVLLLFLNIATGHIYYYNKDFDATWEAYKEMFKKSYTLNEEQHRKSIWEKNVMDIVEHNIRADLGFFTYRKGINEYSDLTFDEYLHKVMGIRIKNGVKYNKTIWIQPNNISVPGEVDWRINGFVTPVKNQGGTCGACWAFAATGTLEGQLKRATGVLVSLSEQNLVDCSDGNDGCNGGTIDSALDYVKQNGGIDTESSYPYKGINDTCRFSPTNVGATCRGYVDLTSGDEEALKVAVATIGPIAVIIDACHNSFMSYKSGIFNEPECRTDIPSHAVLVIGYGTENGIDYWLVKNSWGKSWGIDGYIKMSRNKNNQCGIASRATYALV